MTRLLLCAMLKKPTPDSAAPASIAARADTIPFSRSHPAGNPTEAWNIAHTDSSQNVCDWLQPCACSRASSAAPKPNSNTLTAIVAIQGSQTIEARDLPRMSRSVSPTR